MINNIQSSKGWQVGWQSMCCCVRDGILLNNNDVYDVARLKPSGYLIADVVLKTKKIQSYRDRITVGMCNVKYINIGKLK